MCKLIKNAESVKLDKIELKLDNEGLELIILDNNISPKNFYKYYSLNDNSINSFIESYVYFSHPDQLNDTMEGNLKLWNFENLFSSMSNDGLFFKEDNIKDKFYKDYRNDFFGARGILSLTSTYKNNLFWPHYTNETGFCVEFISNELILSLKLCNSHIHDFIDFPISYQKLKRIDLLKHCSIMLINDKKEFNSKIPSIYTIAIKDELWKYEEEWRIVARVNKDLKFDNSLRKLKYNSGLISKIFLAENFFSNERFDNELGSCVYYFKKENLDYKSLLVFIEKLKESCNDKIYLIGRVERDNVIVKDIEFKISIKEFNNNFIEITKELV